MKMNKKGDVHIDWVISIAIFLTFIIILLAFIKPSYKPSFEGDVLVNMVLKEFNKRAEWNVHKTLLNFNCDKGGVYSFNLNQYISDLKGFKVLKKDGTDLDLNQYKGSLTIKLFDGKDNFWIVNSDGSYPEGSLDVAIDPSIKCEKIGVVNPIIYTGIRETRLNLQDLEMDKWNFPQFRQFRIQVRKSDGSVIKCFAKGILNENECKMIQLPGEIPVYSANIGSNFLDKDLKMEQVILNIESGRNF